MVILQKIVNDKALLVTLGIFLIILILALVLLPKKKEEIRTKVYHYNVPIGIVLILFSAINAYVAIKGLHIETLHLDTWTIGTIVNIVSTLCAVFTFVIGILILKGVKNG